MSFEPKGGFPSLVRKEDTEITEKTLETRGFSTNIVNIGDIMESKKKENLFIAGFEEEDAIDYAIENMLDVPPHEFSEISYKKLPKKLVRELKSVKTY